MLLCPKCGSELVKQERVWRCKNNHSYDISKRGYVHLALHHPSGSGDDKEMVKARTRFLSHGYYEPLQQALVQIVQRYQRKRSWMQDAGKVIIQTGYSRKQQTSSALIYPSMP